MRILKPVAVSFVALVTIGSGTVQILGFFGIKEARDIKMPPASAPHWSALVIGILLFLFGVCLTGYYLWQSLVENKKLKVEAEKKLRAELEKTSGEWDRKLKAQLALKDQQHKDELDKERQQRTNNEAGLMKLAEHHRREANAARDLKSTLKAANGGLFSPLQLEAFQLAKELREFLIELGARPEAPTEEDYEDIRDVEDSDRLDDLEMKHKLWVNQLVYGYASRFSERAVKLLHRLGEQGVPVSAWQEKVKSITTEGDIKEIAKELPKFAIRLDYEPTERLYKL